MTLNPKKVFEKKLVFSHEGCLPIDPAHQIQQVGIDIRINKIYTIHTPIITIAEGIKPDFSSIYREVQSDSRGFFRLEPGRAYSIDSMEDCKIPIDAAAFVLHRSTFNRCGIFITGSVFDPKFEGNIGATMYVHNRTEVKIGTRFAQIVFIKAEAASEYKGTYLKQEGHQL